MRMDSVIPVVEPCGCRLGRNPSEYENVLRRLMATSLRSARSTELKPLDVGKGATEHKYPSLYLTNCKNELCVHRT